MSTGLALTSRTLLEDDFANDTSVDPTIWSPSPSGPAEFIPSMNGGPGTELAPNLPGIANGALDLTLQTFNPHSRQPEDSFYGSEVVSNQSFDNGASGIAFTAVARLGTTQPGMDGGIFPFHNNSSTGLNNEIDFESFTDVAANANNQEQTNVYVNAVPNTVGSPVQVPDPSLTAYQTYTIEWFRNEVLWFIDGQLVRVSTDVPQGPLQFYLNFWASDPGGALQPTDQAHNQIYDFYVQSANVSAIQNNPVRLGDFNGDKIERPSLV